MRNLFRLDKLKLCEIVNNVFYLNEIIEEKVARMTKKTYLTVKEACELIRVSRVTLHRMIKRGLVPSYKIGGKRLFNQKELIQWVKSQREEKTIGVNSMKGA